MVGPSAVFTFPVAWITLEASGFVTGVHYSQHSVIEKFLSEKKFPHVFSTCLENTNPADLSFP